MCFLYFALNIFIIFILYVKNSEGGLRRIYGGTDDPTHRFPFGVVIERHFPYNNATLTRVCSGSLLTENWVITAATCLYEDIKIRHGDLIVTRSQQPDSIYSKIISVVKHPGAFTMDFRGSHTKQLQKIIYKNNIALINIEKVPLRQFAKLSAADYKSIIGNKVIIAGYGATGRDLRNEVEIENPNDKIKGMQIAEGVVIRCDGIDGTVNPAICLGKKCGEQAKVVMSSADVGGPMIFDDKLVGIGSFVYKSTSGYTPVSPYLEWIHDTVMGIRSSADGKDSKHVYII